MQDKKKIVSLNYESYINFIVSTLQMEIRIVHQDFKFNEVMIKKKNP